MTAPEVQLAPDASVVLAQVPLPTVNCDATLENGVAPKLTGPPVAVTVKVPQLIGVPILEVPQLIVEMLATVPQPPLSATLWLDAGAVPVQELLDTVVYVVPLNC